MKAAALFSVIAAGFVLALAQVLGTLSGLAGAIIVGLADGALVYPLFRLFGVEWRHWWIPSATAVVASCVGTFVGVLGMAGTGGWHWLGPLGAALTGLEIAFVGKGKSRICELCRRHLGGAMAFECPRCGLLVCEQRCWRFDSCRCRLCADQAVPVFPHEPRWWDEHFGERASSGKCQLCLSEGSSIDLRNCPRCGRSQCRECWDYANGQCGHCGWVTADLPAALKRYMFPEKSSRPSTTGKSEVR
jgi:hypothetical protein